VLRRPFESAQYTAGDYTQELCDQRVLSSIGTVGDAYDNALAESFVDSYKTELIADRVWRSRAELELATVEWVAWFNTVRLHGSLGDIPPVEFEALHTATEPAPSAERASIAGVDFAARGLVSADNARLLEAGSAQAARTLVKGRPAAAGLSDLRVGDILTYIDNNSNNQTTNPPN
jgi:putative transposase